MNVHKTTADAKIVHTTVSTSQPKNLKTVYLVAWFLCALFYFYQYAVRSAPGVMQSELTAAWGENDIGSIISAYYLTYAIMALVAGVLLDRYGAHRTIPVGIIVVGIGCFIFAQGSETAGMIGFVLQAVGAIFGFIGASYVAARYLPARMLAIFIGLTQCLGMAGAAFGSKPVHMAIDPSGSFQMSWQTVWITFGVIGLVLAIATWFVMPKDSGDSATHHGALSVSSLISPFKLVFGNRQSWYAGIIGGLLFVPTTIGALVWATSFLHSGDNLSMSEAASIASIVPIGWVIGCPLLGYISDKLGKRKPVLIGGALVMLVAAIIAVYVPAGGSAIPRYAVALTLGIASGAAMIPFSMIKEANPPEVKGTAAGSMNFMVFGISGIISPLISKLMGPTPDKSLDLHQFQDALLPLIGAIAVAIILSFFIRETGLGKQENKVMTSTK
ncbi:MFS transporter [Bizionia gelidisalsuginis]|uniref:Lysosomal dipeptide transporter MFSD1 n=1 Tax=Bizionia gelidisalsuginis TaxID=291188 RepID=A0ABY3M8L7_9FLAO|nr:MFS transporter [Bizionia gelidisalsuginis]TYC10584.1 MFS transporter [Bizionia gelidisalsuginis]